LLKYYELTRLDQICHFFLSAGREFGRRAYCEISYEQFLFENQSVGRRGRTNRKVCPSKPASGKKIVPVLEESPRYD
jgi:hypothetical protein